MSISEKIFFDIEKYFCLFNSLALLLYQILQPYLKIMNQFEPQKPFVLIEPMQRHINQGKAKIVEFKNNFEAVHYFRSWCIENNYEEEQTSFAAGGIGHDYLITCFLNY